MLSQYDNDNALVVDTLDSSRLNSKQPPARLAPDARQPHTSKVARKASKLRRLSSEANLHEIVNISAYQGNLSKARRQQQGQSNKLRRLSSKVLKPPASRGPALIQ